MADNPKSLASLADDLDEARELYREVRMNQTLWELLADAAAALRLGVCYDCATNKEAERCAKAGHHEYGENKVGAPFWDRCMWCDHPRGLGKGGAHDD